MIQEDPTSNQQIPEMILDQFGVKNWKGLYFGGIAFKYQKPIQNLEFVLELAKKYVDVVVTSGDGTGIQIEKKKICKFREMVKDNMLGLASGVTCENLVNLIKYADVFIVGTYLENFQGNVHEEHLVKMMKMFQLYNEAYPLETL